MIQARREAAASEQDRNSDSASDEGVGGASSSVALPRGPEDTRRKKRKVQKKKKKKRKNSSSDSNEVFSDDNLGELFQDSHHGDRGLASRIMWCAKKMPGKLLQPGQAVVGVPPVLNQFLQRAVATSSQLEGRNYRELQTIALAGDQILQGNLEGGMDILLQRWKRVEAVATGLLPAQAAEHLELLPPTKPTSLSLAEREEAATMSQRWANYENKTGQY